MFKQLAPRAELLSLIQPFTGVNLWRGRREVRKGFTTTLFGDRNQLIWRGMRIYTWSGSECHSDLNANRGRWLSAATFKTCQDGCRAARIPEMCGEEQQLNLLLQFMGEYLDYQGRGEERERVLASFIPF